MFQAAGLPYKQYKYWDAGKRGLNWDLDGMLADLQAAPDKSVILLHACAHNPTGVDPTAEQWKKIAAVIRAKNHLPFFDSAYQGFASGDLERDAWALRYFVREGFELLAAQSFAKNFGLYNERAGTISFVCASAAQAKVVLSQVKMVIRPNYSNPPAHGARIVAIVLSDPALYAEWKEELKGMSGRINAMRKELRSALEKSNTPGDWAHITSQIGMFSFTSDSTRTHAHSLIGPSIRCSARAHNHSGRADLLASLPVSRSSACRGLNAKQSAAMSEKHHIYMLSNGRISMAGLNSKNVLYVANAMHDVVVNVK